MTETAYKGQCQHCKWGRGMLGCLETRMALNSGNCMDWKPRKLSRAEKRKTKRLVANVGRGGA
jgi:hypothetical protein